MENNLNSEIFTDEDFEKMKKGGISQEEIDNLKYALSLCDLTDLLPQDTDAFLQKVNNYFPDDPALTLKMYLELPEKDPEFFKQLLAFQEFVGTTEEPIDTTSISDALRQIREESNSEEQEKMKHSLIVAIGSAKDDKKNNYISEIKTSLTLEEKQQLADILKNK